MRNIVIDAFAGAGGASVGIEEALGRQVDIAINHDPMAIRMHKMNHEKSFHYTEDIMKIKLKDQLRSDDIVRFLWASPDCTQHSCAKGGKPVERGLRILPYGVRRLCLQILHITGHLPEVIIMENVAEIQDWGPLDEYNRPIKERKGEDYRKFINSMLSLGYKFECKELCAADYGVPTTRKRWYAIFRSDGKPIVWPKQTHSKNGSNNMQKWIPASAVIDTSDYGKSIFGRKKPLAKNTLLRIADGLNKFVISPDGEEQSNFLVTVNHSGGFRGQKISSPLPTITQKNGVGIVSPQIVEFQPEKKEYAGTTQTEIIAEFISKFYRTGCGQSIKLPLATVTTSPGHFGLISVKAVKWDELKNAGIDDAMAERCTSVSQYLIEYYGCGKSFSIDAPLHTVVTKDRFALITVLNDQYCILDIYLRMLSPEELKLAQGFPKDYIIDHYNNWKSVPVSEQTRRIGNSVCPGMAKALTLSNVPYLVIGQRKPNIWVDYSEAQASFVV